LRLPVAICAIPNALIFLLFTTLPSWEPSLAIKIFFVLFFLVWAESGSTFIMLVIAVFPIVNHWFVFFGPDLPRDILIDAVKVLLAQVAIAVGILLAGAEAIRLFMGVSRGFAELAREANAPLTWLSLLLPICAFFAALTLLPLLKPDLMFPAAWLFDTDNLPHFIVSQSMIFFAQITVLLALTCLAIILLMLVPLAHQLLWPLLWKSLHNLNAKLFDYSGLLIGAGVTLIGLAFPGSLLIRVFEYLHKFL
jgi:hypothetical protein